MSGLSPTLSLRSILGDQICQTGLEGAEGWFACSDSAMTRNMEQKLDNAFLKNARRKAGHGDWNL